MTSVRDRLRQYQTAAAKTAAVGDESHERLSIRPTPPSNGHRPPRRTSNLRARASPGNGVQNTTLRARAPPVKDVQTNPPAVQPMHAARTHATQTAPECKPRPASAAAAAVRSASTHYANDDEPASTSSVAAAARRYQVLVARLRADQDRPGSLRDPSPADNASGVQAADSFFDADGIQDPLDLLGACPPAARPVSLPVPHAAPACTQDPLDLLGTCARGSLPASSPTGRASADTARACAPATSPSPLPAAALAGGYLSEGYVSGGSLSSAYFSDDDSDGIVTLDVLAPGVEFANDAVVVADEVPLPPDTPRPSIGAPRTIEGLTTLDLDHLRTPSLHRPRSLIGQTAPDRQEALYGGAGSPGLDSALLRQLSSTHSGLVSRASALSCEALPVRVAHGVASFATGSGKSMVGLIVSPNPSAQTGSTTPSTPGSPSPRALDAASFSAPLDAAEREMRAAWRAKRSSAQPLPKAKVVIQRNRAAPLARDGAPTGRVSMVPLRSSIVRLDEPESPPVAPDAPRRTTLRRGPEVMSMQFDPFVEFMATGPAATRARRGPLARLWARVRGRHRRKPPAAYQYR